MDDTLNHSSRVSERAEILIENIIQERGLKPGDRLPPEREMAKLISASRSSLREAIGKLAARGRVVVGPRGTKIAPPPTSEWISQTIGNKLAAIVSEDKGYGRDIMELRYALDGIAAYLAAKRADENDIARIHNAYAAMAEQHGITTPLEEAARDAEFHIAIADASHNAILRQVMSSMFGLLQSSISESLVKLYTVPATFKALSEQHREIMDSIIAQDPERARKASNTHLQFVETTIRQIDEDIARRARSSNLGIVNNIMV